MALEVNLILCWSLPLCSMPFTLRYQRLQGTTVVSQLSRCDTGSRFHCSVFQRYTVKYATSRHGRLLHSEMMLPVNWTTFSWPTSSLIRCAALTTEYFQFEGYQASNHIRTGTSQSKSGDWLLHSRYQLSCRTVSGCVWAIVRCGSYWGSFSKSALMQQLKNTEQARKEKLYRQTQYLHQLLKVLVVGLVAACQQRHSVHPCVVRKSLI